MAGNATRASRPAASHHRISLFRSCIAPRTLSVAAPAVTDVAELTPELVRTRFQTLLEQQQGRSVDEQLDRLDTASRQLSRLTSDRSLDELAGHFQTWLGYGERATEPVAATTGEFDENTAQLHDVTRYAKPGGTWAYRCILLDAAGRTLEVDMDDEHGRTAYELMQRIRANPLLAKLYRGIVMPLVDHLKRSDSSTVPAPSAAMPAPICGDKKRPAE